VGYWGLMGLGRGGGGDKYKHRATPSIDRATPLNCMCSLGIPLLDGAFGTEITLHQLRLPTSCPVLDIVGDAESLPSPRIPTRLAQREGLSAQI